MVFVARWSLLTSVLYSEVRYKAFLDWRILKWFFQTGGLYSEVILTQVGLILRVYLEGVIWF